MCCRCLKSHIKFAHSGIPKPEKPKKKELCPTCGKYYSFLRNHQRQAHSEASRYRCDACDFKTGGIMLYKR